MALVATPGAADANSYASEAAATAFFAGELGTSAWDAANPANREKALRMATSLIDQLTFDGQRESQTQALSWPRTIPVIDEQLVPVGALPPRLLRATCRLALALLTEAPTIVLEAQPIVRERVGPIETEYAGAKAGSSPRERLGLERYPGVLAELNGLLSAPYGTLQVVRG